MKYFQKQEKFRKIKNGITQIQHGSQSLDSFLDIKAVEVDHFSSLCHHDQTYAPISKSFFLDSMPSLVNSHANKILDALPDPR